MVGSLVLEQCLANEEITQIIALNRTPLFIDDDRYQEIIISDFSDLSAHTMTLANPDVVYYCLGAYSGQLKRNEFHRINVTYPKVLSESLLAAGCKDVRFCLLSGAGQIAQRKNLSRSLKTKGNLKIFWPKTTMNFMPFDLATFTRSHRGKSQTSCTHYREYFTPCSSYLAIRQVFAQPNLLMPCSISACGA